MRMGGVRGITRWVATVDRIQIDGMCSVVVVDEIYVIDRRTTES